MLHDVSQAPNDNPMIVSAKRAVVFALYDGVQLLDFAGPAEAFATADAITPGGAYTITYLAKGEWAATSANAKVATAPIAMFKGDIDTLIVPGALGTPLFAALADAEWLSAMASLASRARRIVSVCSGSFVLGALGLLRKRRATTHWLGIDTMAEMYPETCLVRNALFVEDGAVWTSAGVTAGIDTAVALIARDLGPEAAFRVAHALVLPMMRSGDQTQVSHLLTFQRLAGPKLARLIPWIEARLCAPIATADMAQAMAMSERTLHRQCLDAFGMPPARLVAELRLARAAALLALPDASVKAVSAHCGFGDPAAFSRAFNKRFGYPPEYASRQPGLRSET